MKIPETSLQALSSFPLPPPTPKRACSQAKSMLIFVSRLVEEAASGKYLHSNDTPPCPPRPPLYTPQDVVSERTLKVCIIASFLKETEKLSKKWGGGGGGGGICTLCNGVFSVRLAFNNVFHCL